MSQRGRRTERAVAGSLLAWYGENARRLPWRTEPTPYGVLVSEFMLQQTRVETVRERFVRFLERWPTLQDLAAADEADVVAEWSGLGYYARARNLHRAAVAAAALGGIPSEAERLRDLPGIGPYTAGAIASIAFGRPVPVVDGNVERVLSRVYGLEDDPRSTAGRRALWERAEALVREGDPGSLNQALMELGALLCTPKKPCCPLCPVREACAARATEDPARLPVRPRRKQPRALREVAGLLCRGEAVLLGERRAKGLLGGLWEPIRTAPQDGESPEDALARVFAEETGLVVTVRARLGTIEHAFTGARLSLEVFGIGEEGGGGQVRGSGPTYRAIRFADPTGQRGMALSSLARRTLDLVSGDACRASR